MRSTDSIGVELDGGLAILTLAQPACGNPFDGAFGHDFKQVASDLLNVAGLGRDARRGRQRFSARCRSRRPQARVGLCETRCRTDRRSLSCA